MLFTQEKVITPQSLLGDIQKITNNIEMLVKHINQIEEANEYFYTVQLNRTQITNNLIAQAAIINKISFLFKQRNQQFNPKTLHQLLSYLNKWFQLYYQKETQLTTKQKVIKILQLEGNLTCLEEFLTHALTYVDDIAAFPLGSQKQYSKVYKIIETIESDSLQQTKEQYKTFKKLIRITNAAVLCQLKQSNSLLSIFAFGLSYPRYFVDHKEAKLQNYAFLRKPQLNKLVSIWNLPQNGAISGLKYVQFPYINTNIVIYIPLSIPQNQRINIFDNTPNSVPVRILSNRPIIFWEKQKNCCSISQDIKYMQSVIIHAHGGGFIALSSSTMQNYTRPWSKELDVPVLSIDYKKPPTFRFPAPVFDVFTVYTFVCQHIHNYCNIRPKKIVLAGDSAGGNLVLSTTALAQKAKLPPPKGLFLAYPASDLRSVYSPSRINSFTDAILHPSLLLMCLKEYLGQNQKYVENDPLASPILLTEEFINQKSNRKSWPNNWPMTRIIVGEIDPLLDDSLRLSAKMVQSRVDVHCTIFKGLGHGFLSVEKVIKQGEKCIEKSISLIRQILQNKANQ